MRQHGVNRQGRKWVFGIGQLLDQANTVDDDIWPNTLQHTDQRILVEYIDPAQQTPSALLGEMLQRTCATQCAPYLMLGILA
ncbi:hypothetical protein FQZ97_1097670 [compost metagenome]